MIKLKLILTLLFDLLKYPIKTIKQCPKHKGLSLYLNSFKVTYRLEVII